jgi:hypothetical protein
MTGEPTGARWAEPATGGLAPVLDGVRAALAEAAGYVDALCRGVETVLVAAPGGGGAAAEVAGLRAAFAGVTADVGAMLVAPGDPSVLRAVGRAWVDEVGAPVSRLVGVASDHVQETDDRWSGAAADAYRAVLPAQRTALAAVVALCQEVDDTLNHLAGAITRFWVAVATACLGLVLALAGALGSAAPVVGPPIAAAVALAGVTALVTAGSAALSGLSDVTLAAADRSAALARLLADSTAFPRGAWPRSTSGVSAEPRHWQVR